MKKSFIEIYLSIIRDAISRMAGGGSGPSVDVVPLSVSANGTYTAQEGEAYSPVSVSVQPNVGTKSILENGTYNASSDSYDGYSQVNVDVRGDFLPAVADGYTEYKNKVQSQSVKSLIGTQTGATVTVRVDLSAVIAVGDKVLFTGTDTTNHLTYATWGTVTSSRAYSTYRSITLRVAGVSVRPTGSVTVAHTGYGSFNVVGDLSVQVNSYLEDVSYTADQNGQYTISAQAGYDGIRTVTLDVNVSGGGGGDDPTLTDLYAYNDGVYTPSSGEAYGTLYVQTGQMGAYGEVIPVALVMPVNATCVPSQYVAFSSITADVHPASEGTTVMDVTIYGDGVYTAAPGFAFGEVTIATSSAGPSQALSVVSEVINSNGYYEPGSGEAYGQVDIAVSAGGDNLPAFLAGDKFEAEYAGITEVRSYACYYAKNMILSLPDAVVADGSAFAYMSQCDVDVPSLQYASTRCFAGSDMEYLKLPALTTMGMPGGASSLGTYAFSSMASLLYAYMPNLENLKANAFYGDTNLRRVEFGSGLTAMGDSVFSGCTLLEEVIINNDQAVPTIVSSTYSNTFKNCPSTTLIYVPDTMVSQYQAASGWSTLASRIKPISELTNYTPGEYTPA